MSWAHVGVVAKRKGEQIGARAREWREALEAWG
jgi:hypothetical protein